MMIGLAGWVLWEGEVVGGPGRVFVFGFWVLAPWRLASCLWGICYCCCFNLVHRLSCSWLPPLSSCAVVAAQLPGAARRCPHCPLVVRGTKGTQATLGAGLMGRGLPGRRLASLSGRRLGATAGPAGPAQMVAWCAAAQWHGARALPDFCRPCVHQGRGGATARGVWRSLRAGKAGLWVCFCVSFLFCFFGSPSWLASPWTTDDGM